MRNRFQVPVTPEFQEGEAAMLFSDMADFSKITEEIAGKNPGDITQLVEMLDTYIGMMTDIILEYGGDIVKFAGDAVFAIWPVSRNNNIENSLVQALRCGLNLKIKANNFLSQGMALNARIALGYGSLTVYHVGGIFGRWELVFSGEAMIQATRAGRVAKAGEFVISKEVCALLDSLNVFHHNDMKITENQNQESIYIETREVNKPILYIQDLRQPYIHEPENEMPLTSAEALRAYIPRAILSEVGDNASSRLADYRPVSVIFLKVCNFDAGKAHDVNYINDIMQIIQRCLYQYEGSINRFGIDDKGAVLLAAQGLPPLVHDNDPVRAVRTAFTFRDVFKKNGMDCVIGVGTGSVFCGLVGSEKRNEYTMHGTIVNMTASLMQASTSILCDQVTYEATQNEFEYEEAAAIKVKSRIHPIHVYTPVCYIGA
ncbi:MAG: adenylate/guanylate cyclase domain-containing protein [Spirochaetia bacterium]|nr:adenylate/guanylate cyclase domain-containing protein [Spirochaetia bacterium]